MSSAQILVVEDEGIVALSIKRKLEHLGYGVSAVVASGEAAIQQALTTHPDLILMDIRLDGDLDGIDTAEYIHNQLDIPIVYLTANSDENTLQRVNTTDPFGYILKPFEERELHTTISIALSKHRMEKKLKESEQWLTTTLRSLSDGVITTDAQGFVTFINPVAEMLTGWQSDEALGKRHSDVFTIIQEETRQPVENPINQVLQTGLTINLRRPVVLIAKDTSEKPIDGRVAPIQDDKDHKIGVVLIFQDITEHRQFEKVQQQLNETLEKRIQERTAELLALNEQLHQQAQELARSNTELEQFAYVASHDLREPLRKIKSFSQLLDRRYQGQLDDRADKYIAYIVDGVNRMELLIQDLLTYSRVGKEDYTLAPIDMEVLLHQVLQDLETAIAETDAVVTHDPLPIVMIKSSQIAQLLQNLISNALKFQGVEKPTIHIGVAKYDQEWQFYVRDNGIGIEEAYLERIFLLFQRLHTRGEYPGTGIGLAICKKIMDYHGGRIWAESRLGQGTTFYFTLPINSAQLNLCH